MSTPETAPERSQPPSSAPRAATTIATGTSPNEAASTIALVYASREHRCAGLVCVDGMASGDAGTLHEAVDARAPCPICFVVAERGVCPRDGVAAFARQHPHLPRSWFPTGHGVEGELPAQLAALIRAFARETRPE